MTQSGEEVTLKGETSKSQTNLFSFNNAMAVSYSIDSGDRKKVEVKMQHPDAKRSDIIQMIFVIKGKIDFKAHGDLDSSLQILTQQHNLCQMPSNDTRMLMSDVGDDIFCISLSKPFIEHYLTENHSAYIQLLFRDGENHPMMLSPVNMHITPEINAVLQRMGNATYRGFCDELLFESKVIELLALQISQFEQLQQNALPSSLRDEQLQKMQEAREILIGHTGAQLSLKSLALKVGTNEFNLKRNFKTVFGNTVYGYLNQYKMEQAKAMLIEKDISIAEIANKIGYKHATHFTNAFKKYFGYLPNKIKSGKLAILLFVEDISVVLENFDFLIQ